MIVLLDNRDSFTHNISQTMLELGARVRVVSSRAIAAEEALGASGVVIGPGPGTPDRAGCSEEVVRRAAADPSAPPILGICLGHQALATALGGSIRRATELVHGSTRPLRHAGDGILAGLPEDFPMARYNSLVVDEDTLPTELRVTGRTPDGDIAALSHRERAIFGVQGHPESVLSVGIGQTLFRAFLDLTGGRPFPARVRD